MSGTSAAGEAREVEQLIRALPEHDAREEREAAEVVRRWFSRRWRTSVGVW